MRINIGAAALVIAAIVFGLVACGGSQQPMSVAEYAAWCGEKAERYDFNVETATNGEFAAAILEAWEDAREISYRVPPQASLEAYHDLYAEMLGATHAIVKDLPADQPFSFFSLLLLAGYTDRIEDAEAALAPATHAALVEAGCINEEEAS